MTSGSIASYDKTHLFTPMDEHAYFTPGDHLCRFELDGVPCGLIICYDIRFAELSRSLALQGMDILFIVSHWSRERLPHLNCLSQARAIENQCFVALCNACGCTADTQFGGNSALIGPWGDILARADGAQQTISADCDLSVIPQIRSSTNVFRDRRPDLYQL